MVEAHDADPDGAKAPVASDDAVADVRDSSLWRWRGGRSLVAGLLFAVLGWMVVAGALAESSDEALASARPDELAQILDSLDADNDQLELERRRLAGEIEELTSGSASDALEQARSRKESLEVLAGTTPVRGEGVRIVIRDPAGAFDATKMLDAVQELRDAGAEAIQVAERRVVVNTWFAEPPDGQVGLVVSGEWRPPPYTVLAIGDSQTLATAMEIPGGVADTVRDAGGTIDVDRRDVVEIDATVPLTVPEYAVGVGEE